MKGLYVLNLRAYEAIYGPQERADIAGLVDIYAEPQTPESVAGNPALMGPADVLFSGWGGPLMDGEFLAAAPKLRTVFYGAGSIRNLVTNAFWDRGIVITSAWAANAIPVAEFAVAQIILALKKAWQHAAQIRTKGRDGWRQLPMAGAYGSEVGIISLGMIGRKVCQLLRGLDVRVLAYDPYVDDAVFAELGAERCELDDIFRRAEVVSLHAPNLPSTRGTITGRHFASMKEGAAFINTARGAVVRESELIDVLEARPDLLAVLDVTFPEPPEAGSPLYVLPNVIMTPHVAGSMGPECRRMGRYMVEELRRYVAGEPLKWAIDRKRAEMLA